MTSVVSDPMGALRRMDGPRRAWGLAALAITALAVFGLVRWAGRPTWVTLFHDIEMGEVSAITEKLTGAGIAYQLQSGGATVQVAETEAARARVLLAKDNLPMSGRPGLELFDKPTWGMTDFTQRVTYRRALEGELARTIGRLREVERADVHLTLAEASALRRMEQPAQAAVVLTLRRGAMPGADAVRGITYLVSNSVERLRPENVAVLDDAGHMLSQPTQDGAAGDVTHQLAIERAVERNVADKIATLLDGAVGARESEVRVTAQLNFDQVDQTTESYDPDGAVVANEQRSETAEPVDSVQAANSTVFNNTYQNSRHIERVVAAPGALTRLSVAVLVNEAALVRTSGRNPQAIAARVRDIETLVRGAAGLDSARGDQLSVVLIPFDTTRASMAALLGDSSSLIPGLPGAAERQPSWERFVKPGVAVFGMIVLLILGLRVTRGERAVREAAPRALPAAAGAAPALPAPAPVIERQRPQLTEPPEMAAQVVRAWMAER